MTNRASHVFQVMNHDATFTAHPRYRSDIDGLRAIAILSVVGYHAASGLIPGGFIGVDIFFVISGYLISSIIFSNLELDNFSIVSFYNRRIRRIFPALLLVVTVSLVIGWFTLLPDEYGQLGKHIAGAAAFVSNFVLYGESGYFDNSADTKPMLHLWSLAVEEQFYIFWPLVLTYVWARKRNILHIIVVIAILSFAANIYIADQNPTAAFYWPISRFWELMIGGGLASVALRRTELMEKYKNIQSLIGFVLIGIGLAIINKECVFPGWWALLPTLGSALLISAGSGAWLNKHILSNKIMVGIGVISYPLYLWHWPLLYFLRPNELYNPSSEMKIVAVILSFVLAALTYIYIEKPVRFRKSGWIAKSLFLALVSAGIFGLFTNLANGFGFRYSNYDKEILKLTEITNVYEYFDYPNLIREGKCHSVSLSTAYANGCIETREKNIFIWGDSFAASLYSGLDYVRNQRHANYGIDQLTDGNGPPFFTDSLTDDRKTLNAVNGDRLNIVARYKPNVILIAWMIDGSNGITPKEKALLELSKTMEKIKSVSPNSKIVIVGPFPTWTQSLIKQMVNYYRGNNTVPPLYMSLGLDPKEKVWDDYFKSNIEKRNATYVSAYDALCNTSGCLTRTGDDVADITAVDFAHLTKSGSIYLATKIENEIFE